MFAHCVRTARVSSIALLFVALGIGVPIQGHTHHDEDVTRVGPQGHGHGFVLVQHDMRLERVAAPIFASGVMPPVPLSRPTPSGIRDVPECDEDFCESRAPPNARPRAPPL